MRLVYIIDHLFYNGWRFMQWHDGTMARQRKLDEENVFGAADRGGGTRDARQWGDIDIGHDGGRPTVLSYARRRGELARCDDSYPSRGLVGQSVGAKY